MSFSKKVIRVAAWWESLQICDREQVKQKIFATTTITVLVLAFCIPAPGFVLISACLVLAGFWLVTFLDIAAIKPTVYRSEIRRRVFGKK